jgi:hypothetical protein
VHSSSVVQALARMLLATNKTAEPDGCCTLRPNYVNSQEMTAGPVASTSPHLTMDDDLNELAQRLRSMTIAHGAPAGKMIVV